ncbi:MAG TPA: DUF2339 domain-containing protein [Candidatus Binatia bacterium]
MWFIGLIVGGFIGAIGGGAGAVIGALAGAGVGWALAQQLKTPGGERIATLETSIRLLQQRVASLERSQPRAERAETTPVSAIDEPARAEPASSTPPIAPPIDLPAARTDPPSSASIETPQSTQPQPAPLREPEFTPGPTAPGRLPPRKPPEPSALWNFFFGGNALVRFGVIVLFFGVGFLLKYASEHIEISIEARLIGVALGAIVMLAIGWRLRQTRPGYGLIMQGGGIGLLYLTVFAAFRLYHLLPGGLVFALLGAMAIFSAMLAVLQDSRSLAAMGVTGGFLAPLLASTGGGSHVMLFSFYALLNLGILIIAWFKAWRSLNLLGFAFTFIVGLVWGERYYRAEFFASTEPFLILFFLFYVAIAVLFALRQDATIKSPVDGTLVFGVPLVAFGLQTALVHDTQYATAFSALALSSFYLLLAKALFARASENMRLLVESFLALGVVFGTLAIPLALDGRWTAAAWALEGAGIVWIGVRQDKILARGFGIFLQFPAGVAFFVSALEPRGALPVFNSFYLGCVMISVAGLFSAWYLKQQRHRLSQEAAYVATALFCWGVLWWFGAGFEEITAYVRTRPLELRLLRFHIVVLFVTASCALFGVLRRRLSWDEALYPVMALLPLIYALALGDASRATHPLEYFGYIVWPLAFIAHLWLLRHHEGEIQYVEWWHAAGLWLFAALAAWELAWWIGDLVRGGDVWRVIGWPLVPVALLSWLSDRGERIAWPVARHLKAYQFDGLIPLAGFLWLWMMHANFTSRGDPAPLPYLPLINPLDLIQFAALMALFAWFRRIRSAPFAPELFRSAELAYIGLGSAGFFWLNGVLLRTLHHWTGVPFNLDAMTRSMSVQAAFSIFWSVLALCAMFSATRMRLRMIWLAGAGMMAVVVFKLFFIDLSNIGGIERIVSFIGVGLLMLVIGYVSPVPPAAVEEGK